MQPRLQIESLEGRDVPSVTLVNVDSNGSIQANAPVSFLGSSTDGRYVLLESTATNLVTGQDDTAGTNDVFWRDTTNGTTKLVSAKTGTSGLKALGTVTGPAVISADGLSVVFGSTSNAELLDSTIAAGKDTGGIDLFRWTLGGSPTANPVVQVVTAKNDGTMIGVASSVSNPFISNDGKYVAFTSDVLSKDVEAAVTNDLVGTFDLFRRDMSSTDFTKATLVVSLKNGVTTDAVGNVGSVTVTDRYMTGDGRFFVYTTAADASLAIDATLVDSAASDDVFIRDMSIAAGGSATKAVSLVAGSTTKVDTDSHGAIISRTGDTVAFLSTAKNATPGYELVTGVIDSDPASDDLYVRATAFTTNVTKLVNQQAASPSKTSVGGIGNYAFSGKAELLAFEASGADLVTGVVDLNAGIDVFVYDLAKASNALISAQSDGTTAGSKASLLGGISEDGRYVAFVTASDAKQFQPFITDANATNDVFVRDRTTSITRVISTVADGSKTGDSGSNVLLTPLPSNATSGANVFFTSAASNLVNGVPVSGNNLYRFVGPIVGLQNTSPGVRKLVISGGTNGSVIVDGFGADGKTQQQTTLTPFPGFTGEIRTASGDIDGDGVADVLVAAGPGGGPQLKVYSGATGSEIRNLFVFESTFTGGVNVAVGDFNADGYEDIVVAADNGGGPRVRVLDGRTLATLADFLSIEDPNFRGGARIAVGRVDTDATPDLFVGAGFGGGPRVALYSGKSLATGSPVKLISDFFAFEDTLRNGVYAAIGDLNGDGYGELIVGAGPGGGPRVTAFNGLDLITASGKQNRIADFFAGSISSTSGVRLITKDITGDDLADLVVGTGVGEAATFKTYSGASVIAPGPTNSPTVIETVTPFTGLTGIHVG